MWLISGCRDMDLDCLFRADLEELVRKQQLLWHVAVSRPSDPKDRRYVQDLIREHQKQLFDWMTNKQAILYVCG
jgi:sulfite reductase alpha subunit-like flavoprotein